MGQPVSYVLCVCVCVPADVLATSEPESWLAMGGGPAQSHHRLHTQQGEWSHVWAFLCMQGAAASNSGVNSEALSTDILNEMDALEALAPGTPCPAHKGAFGGGGGSFFAAPSPSEVSSDNFGGSSGGSHGVLSGSVRRRSGSGSGRSRSMSLGARSGSGRGGGNGPFSARRLAAAGGEDQSWSQAHTLEAAQRHLQQQQQQVASGWAPGGNIAPPTLDTGRYDIQRRHTEHQAHVQQQQQKRARGQSQEAGRWPMTELQQTLARAAAAALTPSASPASADAGTGLLAATPLPAAAAAAEGLADMDVLCSPPTFGPQVCLPSISSYTVPCL